MIKAVCMNTSLVSAVMEERGMPIIVLLAGVVAGIVWLVAISPFREKYFPKRISQKDRAWGLAHLSLQSFINAKDEWRGCTLGKTVRKGMHVFHVYVVCGSARKGRFIVNVHPDFRAQPVVWEPCRALPP